MKVMFKQTNVNLSVSLRMADSTMMGFLDIEIKHAGKI